MDTPTLLPCPFCGGTASLDDSVGGAFVSCDLCVAQGPFIQCEHVDYPESMFMTVSVATNGVTIEPPLRVVGDCNDEYYELREQATQKAEAEAAAAWNQRGAWQPIETAPRDGTEILAWNGSERLILLWSDWLYGWTFNDDREILEGLVTHWQPLPSPPPITPNH